MLVTDGTNITMSVQQWGHARRPNQREYFFFKVLATITRLQGSVTAAIPTERL